MSLRVIVIGGDENVYYVTRDFIDKGYHVTVIHPDAEQCRALTRRFGVTTVHGEGSAPRTLEDAGARRADVVLALTPQDHDNLVACQVAQRMFAVPRTIALVRDPDNEDVFQNLGVSVAVSQTRIVGHMIEEAADFKEITNQLSFADGKVQVTELVLDEDAPSVGSRLSDLSLPEGTLIASILRGGEVVIPQGSNVLHTGDQILLVSQAEHHDDALRIVAGEQS